jgi:hypothetical protein
MANATVPAETRRLAKVPPRERRAAVRWRTTAAAPGQVFIPETYETVHAGVLDLSVNGVGLLLSNRLETDTLVLIALGNPNDEGPFEVLASVARATPQRDGSWVVGCSFYSELTEDELDALL